MMAKARRIPYHANVIAEHAWAGLGGAAGLVDRSRAACEAGDPAVMRHQLGRLRAALRKERARGRAGHGSYDLARHLMLSQAVQAAEVALTQTVPAR